MASQELRDARGALLGKVETKSDGKQELRDSRGALKGNYNPMYNETRDQKGALVGKGNILTSLLSKK
ncbi:MAG: hypothetical protein K9I82_06080 [Chitinophagaceae bacterium]|nr:hypothetical protein [Chitinophagaceae bacterium]